MTRTDWLCLSGLRSPFSSLPRAEHPVLNAINPTIRNSNGRTCPTRKSPRGLRARALGRTSLPTRPMVSEDRGASWKGPGICTLQPSQGQNDCASHEGRS